MASGDGEIEIDLEALDRAPTSPPLGRATVYDEILTVLSAGGWVQGRDAHRTRLSLTGAIDLVVGATDGPGPKAASLARSARLRNRLCALAGTTSLVAWNDAAGRSFEDVASLLSMAALAFPDD